jgi:hypothetical protein
MYPEASEYDTFMFYCLRWAEHVAHVGEMRNAHKILVEKPEGKRQLGRPRRRRENNIRKHLREICGLDASGSGYNQVEGPCEHGNEPFDSIKGGKFLDYLSEC